MKALGWPIPLGDSPIDMTIVLCSGMMRLEAKDQISTIKGAVSVSQSSSAKQHHIAL